MLVVHRIIGWFTLGGPISPWKFDPLLCAPVATLMCSEPTRALRERHELGAAGKGLRKGFLQLSEGIGEENIDDGQVGA